MGEFVAGLLLWTASVLGVPSPCVPVVERGYEKPQYFGDRNLIRLPEVWSVYGRSQLVHELVHHVQWHTGHMSEGVAVQVQRRYLLGDVAAVKAERPRECE